MMLFLYRTGKIIGSILIAGILLFYFAFYSSYKERLRWKQYFSRTHIGSPAELVQNYFEEISYETCSHMNVLDLGAGNGSDSIYLSQKGCSTYAVDFSDEAIQRISLQARNLADKNLTLIKSDFLSLNWDALPRFDVIVAINSISFVSPDVFYKVWREMHQNIKKGGIIILRVFGDKLRWPYMENMTLLNHQQINELIFDFEIIKNNEELHKNNDIIEHSFNLILKKL